MTEQQALQVRRVPLVQMVRPEWPDQLAPLVQLALTERLVLQAQQEIMEQPAHKV